MTRDEQKKQQIQWDRQLLDKMRELVAEKEHLISRLKALEMAIQRRSHTELTQNLVDYLLEDQ